MATTADGFWPEYRANVARLLPPLSEGDGVAEERLVAAERRLGVALPGLLREFYLVAGGREDINAAHNSLLYPEDLALDRGIVLFYQENQGVWVCGVAGGDGAADPPVFYSEDYEGYGRWAWRQISGRLSGFLVPMLYFQAALGGMAYRGGGTADAALIARASGWDRHEYDALWPAEVLVREGQLLCIYGSGESPEVLCGGRTREDLAAVAETFGVSVRGSA